MIQDVRLKWLIAILVLALPAAAQAAITIDTVAVGNLGNTDDIHGDGYGGVSYAYNIGKDEVTAGQYRDFLNAVDPTGANSRGLYNSFMNSRSGGCQITWNSTASTYDFSGAPSGTASDWENRPVNYVTFWDAARFANWLHNGQGSGDTESGAYHNIGDELLFGRTAGAKWFIPTEDEWYKAAYHQNDGDTGNYFDYPTSSDTSPGYVIDGGNLSGTGNPFTEGGTDPGNYATYDGDGGTNGIGSPYYRTKVGEWENSASPYGTFDQGGNVREWTEAIIGGSSRAMRGGSFYYNEDMLQASHRIDYTPEWGDTYVGFRVASSAAVPEPGSVLVWAGLGVIGLIWLRRRK